MLKDQPSLMILVLMTVWLVVLGYKKFGQFFKFRLWDLGTLMGKVICMAIETFMTVFSAFSCAELTEELKGLPAMLGPVLFFTVVSLVDLLSANSVFPAVVSLKLKVPSDTVITISLYCMPRDTLFYRKQEPEARHLAEVALPIQVEETEPIGIAFEPTDLTIITRLCLEAENSLQGKEFYNEADFVTFTDLTTYIHTHFFVEGGIAFEPTDLMRLCLEAENSLQGKEFYNEADFVAFTALCTYIRTHFLVEVEPPPALPLDD